MEILFIIVFAHVRRIRDQKLKKLAEAAAKNVHKALPLESVAERTKDALPSLMK